MKKNAEYYGYKVGDKFRYRDGIVELDKTTVFRGSDESVLTLLEDDGSDCPYFKNEDGVKGYEDLNLLVKIEEESTTEPTFKYKIGDKVLADGTIYEITGLPGVYGTSDKNYQGLDPLDNDYGAFVEEDITGYAEKDGEPPESCTEETIKPQDLGCWKQVVDVIGEERAAVELQKVIDIKDNSEVSLEKEANGVCYAFIWSHTPQGHSFWNDIDDGIDPEMYKDTNQNEDFVEAVEADNKAIDDEAVFGIVVRQCDIPEGCTVSVERDKVSISFDHKYYFVTSVAAYEKTMQAIRLLAEVKGV